MQENGGLINDSIGNIAIAAIGRINKTIQSAVGRLNKTIQGFAAAIDRIAAAIDRNKSALDARKGDFVGAGDAHRRKPHRAIANSAEMPGLSKLSSIEDDAWEGKSKLWVAEFGHVRQRDIYNALQPVSAAQSTDEAKITNLEATAPPDGLTGLERAATTPEPQEVATREAAEGVRAGLELSRPQNAPEAATWRPPVDDNDKDLEQKQ